MPPDSQPKPWYRTRNLVLALLGLGAAWVAREIVWAFTAKPNGVSTFAADLNAVRRQYLPKASSDENGYDLVMAAAADLDASAGGSMFFLGRPVPIRDLDGFRAVDRPDAFIASGPAILGELERRGTIDLIRRLAATDRYERPDGLLDPLNSWAALDLLRLQSLATICTAKMTAATDAGDERALVEAFENGLALARHAANEPFYAARVRAMVLERILLDALSEELTHRPVTLATLDALDAALAKGMAAGAPLQAVLDGELALSREIFNLMYTLDAGGDGRLVVLAYAKSPYAELPPFPRTRCLNLAGVVAPSRKDSLRLVESEYRRCSDLLVQTPPPGFPSWRDVGRPPDLNFVAEMQVYAFSSVIQQEERSIARRHAARVHLAVERFIALRGRPPSNIDELVSGGLLDSALSTSTGATCQIILPASPGFPPGPDARRYVLMWIGSFFGAYGNEAQPVNAGRRRYFDHSEDNWVASPATAPDDGASSDGLPSSEAPDTETDAATDGN